MHVDTERCLEIGLGLGEQIVIEIKLRLFCPVIGTVESFHIALEMRA